MGMVCPFVFVFLLFVLSSYRIGIFRVVFGVRVVSCCVMNLVRIMSCHDRSRLEIHTVHILANLPPHPVPCPLGICLFIYLSIYLHTYVPI